MLRKRIAFLFMLQIIAFSVYPLDSLISQRYTISSKKGTIEAWSKEEKRWVPFTEDLIKSGTSVTIASREDAELQLTFEPAIYLTLKKNSTLSLNNLVMQVSKKTIRMALTIQSGDINVKMKLQPGYTLLFSIETPSASIRMGNTDAEFHVDNDITSFQVLRGEAKVKQLSSDIKSIIYEGCKATIDPKRPIVEITSATEELVSAQKQTTGPSIAILSIQSQKSNNENVERISDIVAEQYQKNSNAKVLYLDDIRELLKAEKVEGILNCFTDSCLSKIGALVGVDMMILGTVGQVGQSYVFSLKMIDALRDKTLKRVSTSVEGDLGLILKEIPTMVGELVNAQKRITAEASVKTIKTGTTANAQQNQGSIWIKGGSFDMGLKGTEDYDATPVRNVTIKGFYMDEYEVTKVEYEKVMGSNPSAFRGCDGCSMENISWQEAQDFCNKLGKRLPTEAEWEYACRAGTTTPFHYGTTLSSDQANFDGRNPYGGVPSGQFRTKPVIVGQYQPNGWGLYDMHGNVAEWCADWYDPAYYGNAPKQDPKGPEQGVLKVVRGGSWNNAGTTLRSGKRVAYNPTMLLNTIGFRCVKDDYSGQEK
jgi:formylglycine-generating enzyme required for sulfatase activity